MEFNDATIEGDGDHTPMMVVLHYDNFQYHRSQNCIEAFNTLMQYCFIFPSRLVALKQVNGQPGKNIACNLHMEHLNREAKLFMGANQSVARIECALKPLITAMENFSSRFLQNQAITSESQVTKTFRQ